VSDRRTALITHRAVRIGGLIVGLPAAVILLISGIAHLPIEPVNDVNEATRVDAAEHISNHRCTWDVEGPSCPGEFACYDGFDSERVGTEITATSGQKMGRSARCVTPAFSQRYCGALEQPAYHAELYEDESKNEGFGTIKDCQPLTLQDILTDPTTILQTLNKLLTPVPDNDQYFRDLNLSHLDTEFQSLAADPASATNPATYRDCGNEFLQIENATYQPDEAQTTLLITADLSSLRVNTTLTISADNETLIDTDIPYVDGWERHIFDTAQQPDRITITGTNCPTQNDNTTHIPATDPPQDLIDVWRDIYEQEENEE